MKKSEVMLRNHLGEKLYGEAVAPDQFSIDTPAILLVPGIGMDRDNGGLLSAMADRFAEDGMISYRFDFSGCGNSEGSFEKTSLAKMSEELKMMVNHVKTHNILDYRTMGVFGQCFGTGVIMESEPEVDAICLNGAHTDIYRMMLNYHGDSIDPNGMTAKIRSDGSVMLLDRGFWVDLSRHDLAGKYEANNTPIMFLHCEDDDLIGTEMVRNAYRLNHGRKEYRLLPKTDHNLKPDLNSNINYISDWFRKELL